jgi:hypothetical protein
MATTHTYAPGMPGAPLSRAEGSVNAGGRSCFGPPVDTAGAEARHIDAMLGCGEFEKALERLRALPPSTPTLPALMGRLVIAMARAGMAERTAGLVAEMLTRFPPRPEVTGTLLDLATILSDQGQFEATFSAIEEAVAQVYCMDGSAEFADLGRRMAYFCRRTGRGLAASNMLGPWRSVAVA